MIKRDLEPRLKKAAKSFPAVTLTGPRQSGKSTLCQAVFADHPVANLESPDVRAFASEDPRAFLAQFPKGAIIDEVQRCPQILSYLQGMIDAERKPGRWILTGSQNLALLESVSQSLAGRTAVMQLLPLVHGEVRRFKRHPRSLDEVIFSGSYPGVFDRKLDPKDWYASYVATYVERDVRTVSNVGDLTSFQRFLGICAGRTAQMLNMSSLASDCGIAQPTVKAWLSVLETCFIAFRLPAFSGNIAKRLVKMPKLHFLDSGLVCWLLGIRSADELRTHPLRGAVFESWVVSEILKHRVNQGEHGHLFYYRDQHGIEADLIVEQGRKLTIVEAKAGQTVTGDMLKSARRVQEILKPLRQTEAIVIHGGSAAQSRDEVKLVPWSTIGKLEWV
ncbi:MAG TPA: ATP-binding protein [Phycisphaerae bacterium]|nr:ATP-binding protein [Phycisphaerae bacterium]HRR86033.1 ATP-binding protein [Phycisphaerae bacterium]